MDAKLADKMRRRRAHQLESLRAARESAPMASGEPTERVQLVLEWCSRAVVMAAEGGRNEIDIAIPVKKKPFRLMTTSEWRSLTGELRGIGYNVRLRRFLGNGACIKLRKRPRYLRNEDNVGGRVSADTIYRALTDKRDRQFCTAFLVLVVSF